jgi:hypothetical protein
MEGKDIMVHVDLGEGNDLIRNNHIKVDDEFEDLYMNPIKLSEASEPPVPPVFIRTEQPPVNWQGYYESRMKWIVDRGLRKIDDIMDVSEVGKRRGMLRVEAPEVEEPVALEVVALATTTAKVRELEEERGNILNVFDSTVHSMYQRFSSTGRHGLYARSRHHRNPRSHGMAQGVLRTPRGDRPPTFAIPHSKVSSDYVLPRAA